jgi:hypothetical protein
MSKELQLGCKKCGSVVTIQTQPWTDKVDIKVKDGKIHDHFGTIEILCKKCNKAIATVSIEQI